MPLAVSYPKTDRIVYFVLTNFDHFLRTYTVTLQYAYGYTASSACSMARTELRYKSAIHEIN